MLNKMVLSQLLSSIRCQEGLLVQIFLGRLTNKGSAFCLDCNSRENSYNGFQRGVKGREIQQF